MDILFESLGVYQHIVAVLIGMPRLFVIAMVVPFLGSAVVTGQLRLVLIMSLYMILHPYLVDLLPPMKGMNLVLSLDYVFILVKEIFLGLLLGYLGALIFWAVQSAGFFIDNQRGASQAEGADILSGESISPTGALLFQSICYLFFATGGFLTYMGVIYGSYEIFPPVEMVPINLSWNLVLFFAAKLGWLVLNMLLLAAPITVACLLADVSLGLMNRFASQLNVYVLAMPIKSGLASFLICFYYVILMSMTPKLYREITDFILTLEQILLHG